MNFNRMEYNLCHIIGSFVGGIFTSVLIIYIVGCHNIFSSENHKELHTDINMSQDTVSIVTLEDDNTKAEHPHTGAIVKTDGKPIIEKIELTQENNDITEVETVRKTNDIKDIATLEKTADEKDYILMDGLHGIQKNFEQGFVYDEKIVVGKSINVANLSELQKALTQSIGGETILMKAGVYSDIVIYGKEFGAKGVSIIGEEGTIIENLKINHSQGIMLKNIDFVHEKQEGDEDWTRIIAINKSSDIHIVENRFLGSDDGDAFNDITALGVKTSEDIIIHNNSFKWLSKGIIIDDSIDITVSKNNFSQLNIDGVNIAGGSKNVLVEGNDFRDFYTCNIFDENTCKNHPDFIQVYNDTGKKSNENIEILSNTMVQGVGNSLQSIFIQTNNPGLNNKNITVANNLIYNSHLHGITAYNTDGIDIYNNTLLKTTESGSDIINIPNINIYNSTAVVIDKNISLSTHINRGSSIEKFENNSIISIDDYVDIFRIKSESLERRDFYIKR